MNREIDADGCGDDRSGGRRRAGLGGRRCAGCAVRVRRADPAAPCAIEGGGGFGWEPGEWTDDTQMALAVLTVLATGRTDAVAIGEAMVRWFASRPRDVGNQTRPCWATPCAGRRRPRPRPRSRRAIRTPPATARSCAPGRSRSRSSATATRSPGSPPSVAALTHPHPDSVDACVLWSLAIERAITTARADEPFDWARRSARASTHVDPTRHDAVDLADRRRPPARSRRLPPQQRLGRRRLPGGDRGDHLDRRRSNTVARATTSPPRCAAAGPVATPTPSPPSPARSLGARWGATAVPLAWRRRPPRPTHLRRAGPRRAPNSTRSPASPSAAVSPTAGLARRRLDGLRPDERPSRRARRRLVRQRRRAPRRGRRRRDRRRLAVPDGHRRRARRRRAPHDRPHRHRPDDNPNVAFVLLDTARTIADLVDDGEHVFVHCAHAEHRAPTVAAAYLMTRGADSQHRDPTVHARHSAADPNRSCATPSSRSSRSGRRGRSCSVSSPGVGARLDRVRSWSSCRSCASSRSVWRTGTGRTLSLVCRTSVVHVQRAVHARRPSAGYLVFGVHGLLLWRLNDRREGAGRGSTNWPSTATGWVLTLAIFAYTVALTEFVDDWTGLQFMIVSLSLSPTGRRREKWTW